MWEKNTVSPYNPRSNRLIVWTCRNACCGLWTAVSYFCTNFHVVTWCKLDKFVVIFLDNGISLLSWTASSTMNRLQTRWMLDGWTMPSPSQSIPWSHLQNCLFDRSSTEHSVAPTATESSSRIPVCVCTLKSQLNQKVQKHGDKLNWTSCKISCCQTTPALHLGMQPYQPCRCSSSACIGVPWAIM